MVGRLNGEALSAKFALTRPKRLPHIDFVNPKKCLFQGTAQQCDYVEYPFHLRIGPLAPISLGLAKKIVPKWQSAVSHMP